MSDGRAAHPFDGPEPPDEFDPDLLPDLTQELGEEESFYAELPEDWDVDTEDEDVPDDDPEILAEVDDTTAGTGPANVIVLSGPRAGSVVSRPDGADSATEDGPRLARQVSSAHVALAPGQVLMLVHRPGYYYARMPHALARVQADFSRTGLHLGISAGLPRQGETKTKEYLDRCGAAAVRIADPEGYALPDELIDVTLTTTQLRNVGYFDPAVAPSRGESSTDAWNRRVIRCQRNAGANVLLTPGRALDPAAAVESLEEAGRALDVLLDEVDSSEVPAWNLTLPSAWLTTAKLRDQLLAELVDRDDVHVWHVRVRWPILKPPRAFGQLKQNELLASYRELATTARQEDRALLLPNTGLTGWLTLSWGSTGFGTGPSQSIQAWADSPRIAATPGKPRPRVNRHHASPLMHTISVDSHMALASALPATAYPMCSCPFCAEQEQTPAWQPEVEAGHTVYAMGALAAEVAGTPRRDRATRIRQLVGAANDLHERLPLGVRLPANESPEHLARWTGLLP
jgi:hypothetical protein